MDFYFRAMCGAFVNPYRTFAKGVFGYAQDNGSSSQSWKFTELASRSSEEDPAQYAYVNPDDISLGEPSNTSGRNTAKPPSSRGPVREEASDMGRGTISETSHDKAKQHTGEFQETVGTDADGNQTHNQKPRSGLEQGKKYDESEAGKQGTQGRSKEKERVDTGGLLNPDEVPFNLKQDPQLVPGERPGILDNVQEHSDDWPGDMTMTDADGNQTTYQQPRDGLDQGKVIEDDDPGG
jgi:hypothetical protein